MGFRIPRKSSGEVRSTGKYHMIYGTQTHLHTYWCRVVCAAVIRYEIYWSLKEYNRETFIDLLSNDHAKLKHDAIGICY